MLRRTVLGAVCISLLSGCLADGEDRNSGPVEDPDRAFQVSDVAIPRDVGPNAGALVAGEVVAARIDSSEEARTLVDADPRGPYPEQFVEATEFPDERLVQAEVVVPDPHYHADVVDRSLEDAVGRITLDVVQEDEEGEAPAVPVFSRTLFRVRYDAAGIDVVEVEHDGETVQPTPAADWL